jgi:hypothetical protein
MSDKKDCKMFSISTELEVLDRLDKLFYTRKIDGTVGSKSEFMNELYKEYLDSKGF